ncbi:acyclic terpene utilization AtuA family protein [Conexibacter sp. CPCC 206217]|uniref:acyclic terpene utilization AtuA family protein n=1 Tax=Conexibacter sp. CPCC 206217 TaxID=3064574 RepID=UPI0027219F76|nr:acyclic terpene utilization AtuA family protein [Conexibacter sp. CPCC 206217]MDO8211653.1 acyclic terpene utilization AtuA family protein [Conexibacter sp. CPCC 206217]
MRIGCAAATEQDRLDLGVEMTQEDVEYLGMDCLAERTLALAQLRRIANPDAGYNEMLPARMRGMLPGLKRNGIRLASNFGAANPEGAAKAIAAVAQEIGVSDLKLGVITGDDLLERVDDFEFDFKETGGGLETLPGKVASVNAYIGAEHVAQALDGGADVVVGGRIGDLSLYLGCMMHHFGWAIDDWQRLAAGSAVAHLMECGRYVAGGAFSEPGWRKGVPGQTNLGFPLGVVEEDGTATLGKQASRGGMLTVDTVKEQLLYEVHDPGNYISPDVVTDVREARLEAAGPDRVRVSGVRGLPRTDTLKVLVGVEEGFIAEGEVSFSGRGAVAKAQESREIVEAHLRQRGLWSKLEGWRVDVIGMQSILGDRTLPLNGEPTDVRLRFATRCAERETADAAAFEFQDLWFGPAGGGGARSGVRQIISLFSALVPREEIPVKVEVKSL